MTNKKNQNKVSNALVVYKQQPSKKTKKKKNKNISNVSSGNSALVSYKAALCEPFSLAASGARVPDMFSCPTTTRHITKTITIVTNSSGDADLIVLPSALAHALSSRGNISGGANWSPMDYSTAISNAMVYTDQALLAGQITNYRVVGYGVKVFGVASMSNNSGKVLVATVPISSYINARYGVGGQSPTIANPFATVANTLKSYGIPNSGSVVDISSIPNMINSMEVSMINISERPLFVIPKITSPEAFTFRESTDNSIGFNIVNQTSASNVQAGDASYLRLAGHEAVLVAITGSALSTPVLEVELTYHLEGTQAPNTTAGIIGSDSSLSVVGPVSWMNTVQSVARMPAFRQAVEVGGNSIYPGLGTLANRFY